MAFELNYDDWIHLDAEDLAEQGIKGAYTELLPELKKFVPQPVEVEELVDDMVPRYAVRCAGDTYLIYSPEADNSEGRSWGKAAYAFFEIVNKQLATSEYRFYAINGGNDLGGMFLTPQQAQEAKSSIPRKSDWPYIPTEEHPWYGQQH